MLGPKLTYQLAFNEFKDSYNIFRNRQGEKYYEMMESQGNKMNVKALAYLQRSNFTVNQQFTCIKTHQNF